MKVLLVDDDEFALEILTFAAQSAGFEIHKATDGRSGLALFNEVAPEVVLSDIEMPGMGGLETLKQIW